MIWLRISLPIYLAAYVFVCYFWRWFAFRRATGKNPIILGDPETAHGYVAQWLKIIPLAIALDVLSFAIFPQLFEGDGPLGVWRFPAIVTGAGAVLCLLAVAVSALAQVQMGSSWRVGIDTAEKTELVHAGLYRYSRNPIYCGVLSGMAGLFLILPNAVSLVVLTLSYALIQTVVRMEEEHLEALHGASYRDYRGRVRRWI